MNLDKKKLFDWATPIRKALDESFINTFNREPTPDDIIEVKEFLVLSAMVCNNQVFALVQPDGKVSIPEEFGYESLYFDPETNKFI